MNEKQEKQFVDLMLAARRAERELRILKSRTFPPGSYVMWPWRGYIQTGTVIVNADWSDSIKVLNENTGKEVWIDTYQIIGSGLNSFGEKVRELEKQL